MFENDNAYNLAWRGVATNFKVVKSLMLKKHLAHDEVSSKNPSANHECSGGGHTVHKIIQ
ncbi:hypothetical protein EDD11_006045 [Mortierella claussenii]|nr:hypothetical protein EDD11_006045 [Mortierella claussenii]